MAASRFCANRPPAVGQRHVGILQHAVDRVGRRLPGDGKMQRRRQAVDVGPRSLPGRGELLDGGIARREHRGHRLRAPGDGGARGAEVDQRRPALVVEQDVRRLDVAMQEARFMDLLEAIEQWPQQRLEARRVERAAFLDPRLQGLPAQQLHDQVGGAVGLEEVVHQHDARHAMQRGERSSLGDEAIAAPGKVLCRARGARHHRGAVLPDGERGRQIFLDGHFASEFGVLCAIGDAEAALPQDRDNAIATYGLIRPQRD